MALALLAIVNGDDSAVYRFLSLVTLTFELGRDFCTVYLTTKFDRPTSSRSEVIMWTTLHIGIACVVGNFAA